MSSTTVNYPHEFKGFAIKDPSEWANPKLTSYQPKNFDENSDIDIEIECCGVCGSELSTLQNAWFDGPMKCLSAKYGPKTQCVGHEIVGKAIRVGKGCKTMVKVGDRVGLGAQAYSCGDCTRCKSHNEQYCARRVNTYDAMYEDGYVSQGGYASHVRANENFVFPIPDGMESHLVAPLLCGGLTVYSPIKRELKDVIASGETPKVGIVGIGGLGHIAIMIAKAMGVEVTAFSRSHYKEKDAFKMGCSRFVATQDEVWEDNLFDEFHLILNCTSAKDSLLLTKLLPMLKVNRKFISVGLPHLGHSFDIDPHSLLGNGANFGASILGSRLEILDLFDLVSKHKVEPWVETIDICEKGVNEALTRLENGDVRYRFTLTGFHSFFGTGK